MSECEIVTEDYDSTLRFCLTHDCPVEYNSCGCWRDRAETAEAEVERLQAELAERDLCDATTCPCADPAPVPQWRRLVDEVGLGTYVYPLAAVLRDVAYLAEGGLYERNVLARIVARIVAVAEGQVGDGWKADPDGIVVLERVVQWLLGPLSRNDWRVLGNRAAAWLRSLLDGAS